METEETTSVEEMSHLDLLQDMDDYRSDEDPDYSVRRKRKDGINDLGSVLYDGSTLNFNNF